MQTVPYQRTENGKKFVQQAHTKMIIWWNEVGLSHPKNQGRESFTMHSRDRLGNRFSPTPDLGISRLKKQAYAWKSSIKTAIIYDNKTGAELHKFTDGSWT